MPLASAPPAQASLPALVVDAMIIDRAQRVLAQLETQRQAILTDWAARDDPGREQRDRPPAALTEALDPAVRQPVESTHQLLERGLANSRANVIGFAAAPRDPAARAALAEGLTACLVATETIAFYTAAGRMFYALLASDAELNYLLSWWLAFQREVILPVLEAGGRDLDGSDRRALASSLSRAQPQLESARAYLNRYAELIREWGPRVRAVIRALDALLLCYAIYEVGLAFLASGGGGPPAAGALVLAGGAGRVVTGVVPRIVGWTTVLEHLAIIGGLASQVVLMSAPPAGAGGLPPAAGASGSASIEPDPHEDWEASRRGQPRGDPQPARDGFYPPPSTPEELATQARRLLARDLTEAQYLSGRPFSDLPVAIRRRFGYWLMREIYPQIVAVARGGRGLVYSGGLVTRRFVNSLRGQAQRVIFIESSLRVSGGRLVRLDAFEVTFADSPGVPDSAEVIDLTTSLREEHLFGTGEYAGVLRNLGFRVTSAADLAIWDGDRWIVDLGVFPAPTP